MSRRGANEGTIRLRPDGRWEARVLLTGPDGVRRRRSLLARSRGEVRDKLAQALRQESMGVAVPPATMTLAGLLDLWLRDVVRPNRRSSTYRSYAGIVRVHLVPALGAVRLTQLTPQQVQSFLNAKARSGLSPQTVGYVRAVLRNALRQGEKWGLVVRNVAALADPPRIRRHEIAPFTLDEARRFLEVIQGDRLEGLYALAIGTGLRQGELLGLSWTDLDLHARTCRVRQALQRVDGTLELVEPKSAQSHRSVDVPDFAIAAVQRHRTRQRHERLMAGSRWRADERDLVFRTTIGTPMDGGSVTHRLQALLKESDLPRQRFHDLRHAYATLMLVQGIAPRVVMGALGHSQISLTLNTYSHVLPGLGRDAADQLGTLLGPQGASESA